MKKANVLGTEYTIKLCVVADFIPDTMSKSNLDEYRKKVIRHE